MSAHPREHEELLAALAAGERAPSEPEVDQRLRDCAACARAWTALQDSQRRLAGLGETERAALAELADLRGTPGEERVLPILARLSAAEPHGAKRRRPLAAWLVAAVVLVAGAWILLQFAGDSKEDRPPVFLGERLEILTPRGLVTSFAPFAWNYGGGADSYAVRIYDAADAARANPLLEKRLKDTSWTPPAQDLERLPARIVWVVEALDAFGNVRFGGSASAEAWRSP